MREKGKYKELRAKKHKKGLQKYGSRHYDSVTIHKMFIYHGVGEYI